MWSKHLGFCVFSLCFSIPCDFVMFFLLLAVCTPDPNVSPPGVSHYQYICFPFIFRVLSLFPPFGSLCFSPVWLVSWFILCLSRVLLVVFHAALVAVYFSNKSKWICFSLVLCNNSLLSIFNFQLENLHIYINCSLFYYFFLKKRFI